MIARILAHLAACQTAPLSVPWNTNINTLRGELAALGVSMTPARGNCAGVDFYSFARAAR